MTVTLAYGNPTLTVAIGNVSLPDNVPTVSSIELMVVLIMMFLVIIITHPW
jgi:hypothetical protein